MCKPPGLAAPSKGDGVALQRSVASLASLLWCLTKAVALIVVDGLRLVALACGRPAPLAASRKCEFYEGTVAHVRSAPLSHRFNYAVRYCLVDLDSPDPPPACCAPLLADRLTAAEARALTGCAGKVKLLLLPASAGYDINPIVVYYCHGPSRVDGAEDGPLEACVAQVDNTPWGDRVTFCFDPSGDAVPKPMHVSPLQDMQSDWLLRAPAPAEALCLSVDCRHPELGRFFHASLRATRVPAARRDGISARSEHWAWLMPHRVAVWIYWHAALLLWRGLPFLSHPKSVVGAELAEGRARAVERHAEGARARRTAAVGATGRGGGCPYIWRDQKAWPWDG